MIDLVHDLHHFTSFFPFSPCSGFTTSIALPVNLPTSFHSVPIWAIAANPRGPRNSDAHFPVISCSPSPDLFPTSVPAIFFTTRRTPRLILSLFSLFDEILLPLSLLFGSSLWKSISENIWCPCHPCWSPWYMGKGSPLLVPGWTPPRSLSKIIAPLSMWNFFYFLRYRPLAWQEVSHILHSSSHYSYPPFSPIEPFYRLSLLKKEEHNLFALLMNPSRWSSAPRCHYFSSAD